MEINEIKHFYFENANATVDKTVDYRNRLQVMVQIQGVEYF